MAVDLQTILINDTEYSDIFTDFTIKNVLTDVAEVPRTADGTLNDEATDYFYVPQCEFMFGILTPEQYSEVVQIINTRGFIVELYDYELGMRVRRKMRMTTRDLPKMLAKGNKLKYLQNTKFTMVSKFGYEDYADLKARATNDTRF